MENKNVTNEQLAELIEGRLDSFGNVMDGLREEMGGLREEMRDIRSDLDILKEGAFTKDEKEETLNMVRHYNQQLENDALGKKNITLTRDEYDGVAKSTGFQNRFAKAV